MDVEGLTWHTMPEDAMDDSTISIEYAIDADDLDWLYQRVSDLADGSCQVWRYPCGCGVFDPADGQIPEFDDNAGELIRIANRPAWLAML